MKRTLLISTIFLVAALALTGCGNKTGNGNQATNSNQPRGGGRMPDFGQPDKQPDVRGIVKSVTGNQVTVLKLERPKEAQAQAQGDGANASGAKNGETQSGSRSVTMGGGMGMTGSFRGGRPGEEDDSTTRADMLEKLKAMSTGEETITIPVGIQMLKPSSSTGTKKMEMIEATLSDIVADKSVTIWLDNSITDKKVASFVLVN